MSFKFLALQFSLAILVSTAAFADFDQTHKDWSKILSQHVKWNASSSTVDYKALKSSPKDLNSYLAKLSSVSEKEFSSWSRDEQLAFLINAYNAWTVKLILDHYPVSSIKKIGGVFSNPWKLKIVDIFGNKKSLDWIEHEKIRPEYKEPLIHFAVVCASKGCPGLRTEAFTANTLSAQLEDSARRFLTDSDRNRIDFDKNEMALSSIFKWYKDDFVGSAGSLEKFVLKYSAASAKNQAKEFKISFKDYDWSLNEK